MDFMELDDRLTYTSVYIRVRKLVKESSLLWDESQICDLADEAWEAMYGKGLEYAYYVLSKVFGYIEYLESSEVTYG